MKIIDIHSHILPGIDDGSKSMEMSIEMVRMAMEQGVKAIVATPHSSRRTSYTKEKVKQLCEALMAEVKKATGHHITIYPGQEIFCRGDTIENLKSGRFHAIADTSYVLIEFFPEVEFTDIYKSIRDLSANGYRIILAHVERYGCLRKMDRCDDLLRQGVYFQLNTKSISGSIFDDQTRWCRKMLKLGKIHFIGSDMHNTKERRPDYGKAVSWMMKNLNSKYVEELCYGNIEKILKI